MFEDFIDLPEEDSKSCVPTLCIQSSPQLRRRDLPYPIPQATVKKLLERSFVLGSQLSEENLRSAPTKSSHAAASDLISAIQAAQKRKRNSGSGKGSSSRNPKKGFKNIDNHD